MEDVQTSWGILPRWKARALCLGEIQAVINAVTRDDDAGASALSEEQKPPPLAADAEEPRKPTIDPDVMKMIEDRIDDLTARLDRYERRFAAEAALDALETEIEQMYPPSKDDDGDLVLN
jgi:hypothetical protein